MKISLCNSLTFITLLLCSIFTLSSCATKKYEFNNVDFRPAKHSIIAKPQQLPVSGSISWSNAHTLKSNYKRNNPIMSTDGSGNSFMLEGMTFKSSDLAKLCSGSQNVMIYFGKSSTSANATFHLIAVGVDAEGALILPAEINQASNDNVFDKAVPCPPCPVDPLD
ncbi:MAG: hypothetical protein ACOYOA_16555 [Saprospiraceae bacterium]